MTPVFRFMGCGGASRRHNLVHDIAEQVVPLVMRRLRSDAPAMSAAELRGYVRARAWHYVCAAVQRRIARQRRSIAMEKELIADVLERTVHLAIREHRMPPVVPLPMPHVQLRAAA